MALPTGNAVISDKMQFPSSGSSVGQWFQDERDAFISWLRGEFAAANAIIDSLCHHLQYIGEPGEYDVVLNCIQQRRCNWNPVLHLQQYFPIDDVMYSLQQATWTRRQQRPEKDFRRSGSRYRQLHKLESNRDNHNHTCAVNSSVRAINAVANREREEKLEKREEAEQRSEAEKSEEKEGTVILIICKVLLVMQFFFFRVCLFAF